MANDMVMQSEGEGDGGKHGVRHIRFWLLIDLNFKMNNKEQVLLKWEIERESNRRRWRRMEWSRRLKIDQQHNVSNDWSSIKMEFNVCVCGPRSHYCYFYLHIPLAHIHWRCIELMIYARYFFVFFSLSLCRFLPSFWTQFGIWQFAYMSSLLWLDVWLYTIRIKFDNVQFEVKIMKNGPQLRWEWVICRLAG